MYKRQVLSGSECVRRPVEDAALWNLQLECLRKAVDTLGTQDQDLIELRYGRSLTMEEIGINYGAVSYTHLTGVWTSPESCEFRLSPMSSMEQRGSDVKSACGKTA